MCNPSVFLAVSTFKSTQLCPFLSVSADPNLEQIICIFCWLMCIASPWHPVTTWNCSYQGLQASLQSEAFCLFYPMSPLLPPPATLALFTLDVWSLFLFFFSILKSLILTCVPKHAPPSHLPPHNISVGHPHAPAPSMLYPASDIDWRFNSYMIVYML